jgi:hypothetical protein
MFIYQPSWILAFVFTFVFFGAGRAEARGGGRDNAFLWAGLSFGVSALVLQLLHAGWVTLVIAQAALFVAIGVFRAWRQK